MSGTLYLVATPIGNLEDITYRAVRVLSEVDLIACEDTRRTRKVLEHFDILKPLVSYHEYNEAERAVELVEKLNHSNDIALVSDAGTPLVSDPGYVIVKQASEAGIPVVPVPGASAALSALAASGLPSDSFHFVGFLPVKGTRRRQILELIRTSETTVILYEAPHRILRTLDDLRQAAGDRPIVAAREMTKLHEEFLRGTAESVKQELSGRSMIKGEFTIVIGKPERGAAPAADTDAIRTEVERRVADGESRMDAIKAVAQAHSLPKREVYSIMEQE